jgi:molecular chaperone GrpE (heat shock protein)
MSELHLINSEPDFDLQMKSLAAEAEQQREETRTEPHAQTDLAEALKPLVAGMDSLRRAIGENRAALERLREKVSTQDALPELIGNVQETIAEKNCLNQSLFDSLHEELRTYKDGFLLEILHRPVACDLITLFDDLSLLHNRTQEFLTGSDGEDAPAFLQVKTFNTNLDHVLHSLIEVLARIGVQRLAASAGKLDKQMQRVVLVQSADAQEEDLQIVSSVKPGFMWRERLLRPEEVVIKRWKDSPRTSLPVSQK